MRIGYRTPVLPRPQPPQWVGPAAGHRGRTAGAADHLVRAEGGRPDQGFRNKVIDFFGAAIPFDPPPARSPPSPTQCGASSRPMACSASSPRARSVSARPSCCRSRRGRSSSPRVEVPIVPAAIVGSTHLWLGRRVEVRFGDPISTEAPEGMRVVRTSSCAFARPARHCCRKPSRCFRASGPARAGRPVHRRTRPRAPAGRARRIAGRRGRQGGLASAHAAGRLECLRRLRGRRLPDARCLLAGRAGSTGSHLPPPSRGRRERFCSPDDPGLRLRRRADWPPSCGSRPSCRPSRWRCSLASSSGCSPSDISTTGQSRAAAAFRRRTTSLRLHASRRLPAGCFQVVAHPYANTRRSPTWNSPTRAPLRAVVTVTCLRAGHP